MTSPLLAIAFVFAQAAADPIALTPTAATLQAGVLSGDWQLKDGVLTGRAAEGQIAWYRLPGGYWDFEFETEFMTPSPANGGSQVRAHWLPKSAADLRGEKSMHGYHANIDTREPGHTGEVLIAHGQPPLSAATKDAIAAVKPGDWNTLSIRAVGPVTQVSVNGVPAAVSYDESFIGGFIALQVSGDGGAAEVQYKNPRVRDLGRAGEWRALFDGKSLAGWKVWGTEDFHVKDGVIECRRGPKESEGYLATEETWSDFRVSGRFHMLGDGNYGLFFHSTIKLREKDGYPMIAGVQGEVEPSFPGSTGWAYESYRRGWLVEPDKTSAASTALRPGEWNEIEIRRQGNRLTTWVNGFRVLEWLDPAPQLFSGSFALQLHTGAGAGIDWKDLYVTNP